MDTHERIWLIDMGDCVAWHDDPNPEGLDDYDKPDSIEYVHRDLHDALEQRLIEEQGTSKVLNNVLADIRRAVGDNGKLMQAELVDHVAELSNMVEGQASRLKGAFHGCPHHADDYEACIQHSGTAPCGVEKERDALAERVEFLNKQNGMQQEQNDELTSMLEYELATIAGGGPDVIDDDEYEIEGEGGSHWKVSISDVCERALDRIEALEKERDALAERVEFLNKQNGVQQEQNDELVAHVERITSRLEDTDSLLSGCMREYEGCWTQKTNASALEDAPATTLNRRDARMKAEGAEAVRHLTQGEDWKDGDLKAVIEDYVAKCRHQAEGCAE